MQQIYTLQEVQEMIGELQIGKFKEISKKEGYFIRNTTRGGRDFILEDEKIKFQLRFPGTSQPISFGFFKSKKGYNTKFKYKESENYANHYGEYISYIILKQLGKKACKVDLVSTFIKHPYSGKEIPVEGCLSHSQLQDTDTILGANIIIEDFKNLSPSKYRKLTPRGRTNSDINYTNVELMLQAFESKFKINKQENGIPQMRKDFFDMCAFDIVFANRDRHDENFALKINQETDELSLYHLYDNEQILGMQTTVKQAKACLENEKKYKEFKEKELTSCIGIPGKTRQIRTTELLEYLLEHYPEEIMTSLNDIRRFKINNLEELLDCIDGLSQVHKDFAKKIFLDRQREIDETISKYQEKMKKAKKMETEEVSL